MTRGQLVRQLVDEYHKSGKDAAVALFDRFIKEFGITQFTIKAMILEFREEIAKAVPPSRAS